MASTDPWDFFIAHAGADLEPAKRLYDLLSPAYRVFLDSECLILGDSWTQEIPAAQRESRVTLVLISDQTPKAWYEVEEIAQAVGQTRHEGTDGHRVVPIFLDGRPIEPSGIPYGLWQLHAVDVLAEGGIEAAANELRNLMDRIGRPARTESEPAKRPNPDAAGTSTRELLTVRQALGDLLQKLFTLPELRRFLATELAAPNLDVVLSTGEADRQSLATEAIDALLRDGQINDTFFDRLHHERGYRAADINVARRRWQDARDPELRGVASHSAKSHAARAESAANGTEPPEPTALEDPTLATLPTRSSGMTARNVLGAALKLDRSPQWGRVIESCQREGNVIFLLYGHSRQGLGLFLDRLQYYLSEESRLPHRVFRVPFRLEHGSATSGAEWELHLAHALAPGEAGTAADHLARAALHQGVLLILGTSPLHDLTTDHRHGLRDFLCESLPAILERARPASPVRFLLAVDYDREDDPLPDEIDRWALDAERSGVLDYVALQEVGFPSWEEVRAYLRNLRPRPDDATTQRIRVDFDTIVNSEVGTFQLLAERLDRHWETLK